jgi:hypothetical protein
MDAETSLKVIEVVKRVADLVGGEYNVSPGGTPRIIVTIGRVKCSCVYISRSGQWKVFFPFPAAAQDQEKMYFEDLISFVQFVNKNNGKGEDENENENENEN